MTSNAVTPDLDVANVYTGGDHLKAADIPADKKFDLSVERITLEEMPSRDNKPSRKKLVLAFAGATKTLVLNTTNAGVMAGALGPKPAKWVGARVLLERTTVPFGGNFVPALRITKVSAGDAPPVAEEPQQSAFVATDDDVSFLN